MKKMQDKLVLFFKGMVLGVAFIIPGVSGGTLAVLLGIYEDLIEAMCNFYKGFSNFKKYVLYLIPIMLGVVFSIGVCARLIEFGLSKAPIITMLVFVGLIIGGIPKLFKDVGKKPGIKEISGMLVGIVIVLLMLIVDKGTKSVSFSDMNMLGYVLLVLVGMLASATMVIPGISGSFTLMLIGYYEPILNTVNSLTSFNNVGSNLLIILPFLLGVVVGIVGIAKIIEFCLRKYHVMTYYVIIGFVISSVFSVFYQVTQYSFNVAHLVIGLVLMCIDSIFVYKVFKD